MDRKCECYPYPPDNISLNANEISTFHRITMVCSNQCIFSTDVSNKVLNVISVLCKLDALCSTFKWYDYYELLCKSHINFRIFDLQFFLF